MTLQAAPRNGTPYSARVDQGEVLLVRQSPLFDLAYYVTRYPDVRANQDEAVDHYLSIGASEGRDPSPDFSTLAYLSRYPDVAQAGINPLVHYLSIGRAEGRQAFSVAAASAHVDRDLPASDIELLEHSAFFDRDYYLRRYPEVAASQRDPVLHYLQTGAAEGRDPCPEFSTRGYLAANPDVAEQGLNPLVHFLRCGLLERRDPGLVDEPLSAPASDTTAEAAAISNKDAALLRASNLFDAKFYLQHNPDVARSGIDPVRHYLSTGAREGRDPSQAFSTLGYLRRHKDVAAAHLNPLVHYLQRGKTEGRTTVTGGPLIPSFAQLYEERWPSLRPLAVFHTPSAGPRLTIVTDSVGTSSLFGGVGTALILGTLLANRLGATLRLATRREAPDARALTSVLSTNGIALEGPLEIAFAPEGGEQSIPLTDDDLFLTTSWWTTRSTLGAAPRDRVAYLLQEDERMFYPFGDERLLCAETLEESNIPLVINTQLLFRHLFEGPGALENRAADAMAFEPAFPAAGRAARAAIPQGKRRFFFYSRPHNQRNLFWRGASALADAVEDGVLDPGEWDFYWVGKDTPALMLARGVEPKRIQGLDWAQYQALVADMDAALVLMDTPHPSYPPLDLAGAGVAVLTNTHAGKTDLSRYSKNIVMSAPTRPALHEGLAQVAALGRDDAARMRNRAADGICRDWNTAMSEVVEWLCARFARNS